YPNQWFIIEALEAHTTPDKQRHLDCLAVLDTCPDGSAALQRYRHLHQQCPFREFYFVHTSRAELDIREREWEGYARAMLITSQALLVLKAPEETSGPKSQRGLFQGRPDPLPPHELHYPRVCDEEKQAGEESAEYCRSERPGHHLGAGSDMRTC